MGAMKITAMKIAAMKSVAMLVTLASCAEAKPFVSEPPAAKPPSPPKRSCGQVAIKKGPHTRCRAVVGFCRSRTFCHCVLRPPAPCGLKLSARKCRYSVHCKAGEVCWFARCLGPQAKKRVADCFSAVFELQYGGVASDRVYHYTLSASLPATSKARARKTPRPAALWAPRELSCSMDGSRCGYYDTGTVFRLRPTGFMIAGDTWLTAYFFRKDERQNMVADDYQQGAALRWSVKWPFSADTPKSFASSLRLLLWPTPKRALVVHEATLPARDLTTQTKRLSR
jgi:hypothetical protein